MKVSKSIRVIAAAIALATASAAYGSVVITEFMYNGLGTVPSSGAGEYVELLNNGATPVDFTGWSFDDSSHTPGSFSLSGLGTIAPGQYAFLTDVTAAAFRSNWNLDASVDVLGGNNQNLGRADEINIYDNTNAQVDKLTYDDQTIGGPRANAISVNILPANYGTNHAELGVLSTVGDQFGSYKSVLGEVGNPAVTPEPACLGLLGAGAMLLMRRRRSV